MSNEGGTAVNPSFDEVILKTSEVDGFFIVHFYGSKWSTRPSRKRI
jgi:hypothetical protein